MARKKELDEAERKKELLRKLRKGPDLDKYVDDKKRRDTSYAGGARIYSMSYYTFIKLAKAAVSGIVPRSMRSTGFGIFETGFGIAWFLGSWLLGALYDLNPVYLVTVSVVSQFLAIAFYALCLRCNKTEC